MRILFIVGPFPKISETFILNTITALIERGHTIFILASHKPDEKFTPSSFVEYKLSKQTFYLNIPTNKLERLFKGLILAAKIFFKKPNIAIESLNFFKYKKFVFSLRLIYVANYYLENCQISSFDPDIIHCQFGPNGLVGVFLKEIGVKAKCITTFHGYDINSYPKKMGRDIYKILFKKCNLFTANTEYTKERIAKLGCNRNKIFILPMPVDLKKIKFTPRNPVSSPEKITLLTVGRLVEKKGHEYAIKALKEVSKMYPNFQYLIIGDGPLKKSLQKLTKLLNLEKNIKFLGAFDHQKVIETMLKSHIFILPSATARDGDKEGQALVLQEAQASGMPVISTYHNGIPEGLIDGETGFLVPEKDYKALAQKIIFLINNQNLWRKMGEKGRKFVEKKYNIETITSKLESLYEKAIKSQEPNIN